MKIGEFRKTELLLGLLEHLEEQISDNDSFKDVLTGIGFEKEELCSLGYAHLFKKPITIEELLCFLNPEQEIEIAIQEHYFRGKVKDIPNDIYSYTVDYIAAGNCDSRNQPNVLLLDAMKGGE